MTIIRKPRIGTIRSLTDLPPGQSAVLDDGAGPPRLVHRRADGSVAQTAEEVRIAELERQLVEVRAALPLPRVGIRSVLPRVSRNGSEGDSWTYAPALKTTDAVGDWAPDLTKGTVTVPRTGVYTVSVTYVLICENGAQSYNIVLFSSLGGEKIKVIEGSGSGAVGGTAAGIIQAQQGETFRLGFRTSGQAFLYDLDLCHWTIRQEAD